MFYVKPKLTSKLYNYSTKRNRNDCNIVKDFLCFTRQYNIDVKKTFQTDKLAVGY